MTLTLCLEMQPGVGGGVGGAVRKRAEGLQGEGTMTKDAGQRSHSQGCRSKTPWPSKDAGG